MASEPVLVGVDFTADAVRVLMTDEQGRRVADGEWPLPELPDEESWSWEVGGRIASLFAAEGDRRSALAITVAAPGSVEPETGRLIESAGQESWDGLAIVDSLRRHIGAPISAESRTVCALLAETWQGVAAGVDDVLYVSLRGVPSAAMVAGGRPVRGAHLGAGSLPAAPELDASAPLGEEALERLAGLLADVTALLDPEMVVLDGAAAHLDVLVPLLEQVLEQVAPGPEVVRSVLGERAAIIGAIRLASSLAFEGGRRA
jgi:predicted NBD/HSP70 family sugar kinase